MKFDNLSYRLKQERDSKQKSLINKTITGGEDQYSSINKTILIKLTITKKNNTKTIIINNIKTVIALMQNILYYLIIIESLSK